MRMLTGDTYPNMSCCGLEYLLNKLATIALLFFCVGSDVAAAPPPPSPSSSESAITYDDKIQGDKLNYSPNTAPRVFAPGHHSALYAGKVSYRPAHSVQHET